VGASAGFTDQHIASLGNIQSYVYHEAGFIIDTQCIHNDSMVGRFDLVQPGKDDTPNMYNAVSILPNSDWTFINQVSGVNKTGKEY
jgi:hypothetical protein